MPTRCGRPRRDRRRSWTAPGRSGAEYPRDQGQCKDGRETCRTAQEQHPDDDQIDAERRLHDAQHLRPIEGVRERPGNRPDEEVGAEVERERQPDPGSGARELVHREPEQQHLPHHRRTVEERHGKEPAKARSAEGEEPVESPDHGRRGCTRRSGTGVTEYRAARFRDLERTSMGCARTGSATAQTDTGTGRSSRYRAGRRFAGPAPRAPSPSFARTHGGRDPGRSGPEDRAGRATHRGA